MCQKQGKRLDQVKDKDDIKAIVNQVKPEEPGKCEITAPGGVLFTLRMIIIDIIDTLFGSLYNSHFIERG